MPDLFDHHGLPMTFGEAINECHAWRSADTLAIVDILIECGCLKSRAAFKPLRIRALARIDQELAARTAFLQNQPSLPEIDDVPDDLEEREEDERDELLEKAAESILALVKDARGGWRAVVSPPTARAIEMWASEVAQASFVNGVEALSNLEVPEEGMDP